MPWRPSPPAAIHHQAARPQPQLRRHGSGRRPGPLSISSAPTTSCIKSATRLPAEGHAPWPSTRGSSTPAYRRPSRSRLITPGARTCLPAIKELFQGYAERRAEAPPARLRRSPALLGSGPRRTRVSAPLIAGRFRPPPRRRVPGHQCGTPGRHSRKRSWTLIGRPRQDPPIGPLRPKVRSWSSATTPRRFTRSAAAPSTTFSHFHEQLPGHDHGLCLEQNYRSITPILTASNAVMEPASERLHEESLVRADRRAGKPSSGHLRRRASAEVSSPRRRVLRAPRRRACRSCKQAVLFRARPQLRRARDRAGPAATFRSSSGAGSSSWKRRTSRTCLPSCGSSKTRRRPELDARVASCLTASVPGRATAGRDAPAGSTRVTSRGTPELAGPGPAAETLRQPGGPPEPAGAKASRSRCPAQIDLVRKSYSPLFQQRYDNPEVRLARSRSA